MNNYLNLQMTPSRTSQFLYGYCDLPKHKYYTALEHDQGRVKQ